MCGIVGAIAKYNNGFNTGALAAFTDLLFMDTLRGPDSTGVFLVDKDGDTTLLKDVGTAQRFLVNKDYDTYIDTPAYKIGKALVGHNRKATIGKVDAVNAHPFTVNGEFVLVHNGSLPGHKHLGDAEVDSNAIAQYLHDKWKDDGTPEEKADLLAHIGGAWALVWYDLRTNKLNIVRNSQRPLSLIETNSEWFFASKLAMLRAGLSRNNLTEKTLVEIQPLVVYSFNLEDPVASKVEEVVLPTAPFFPQPKATHTKQQKTGGKQTQTPGDTDDALSKSAFKKFTKGLIGREISFYVEDFVDVNAAGDEHSPLYFYGENFAYNFHHEITGMVAQPLAMQVMDNYNCAVGKVVDVGYHKATRCVKIQVAITGATQNEAATTH